MKLKIYALGIVFLSLLFSLNIYAQTQLTITGAVANVHNSDANAAWSSGGNPLGWSPSTPAAPTDWIYFNLGGSTYTVTQITMTLNRPDSYNYLQYFDIQASNDPADPFTKIRTVTVSWVNNSCAINLTNLACSGYQYIRFANFQNVNSCTTCHPAWIKNVKIYGDTFTPLGNVMVTGNLVAMGKVGIGCSSPAYPLCVNGKIQATEVEVKTAPCADYVFEPDYQLQSLQEVELFINENKHLPEVPSAAEFSTGYNIGEMDNLLLKKVEELTLYIIEQNKKIEVLQTELNTIKQNEEPDDN